jgi:hypothetical protein
MLVLKSQRVVCVIQEDALPGSAGLCTVKRQARSRSPFTICLDLSTPVTTEDWKYRWFGGWKGSGIGREGDLSGMLSYRIIYNTIECKSRIRGRKSGGRSFL